MAVTDIGMDLGSSNFLVYIKGRGIVIKEPSIVAYDKEEDKVLAFGDEARQMVAHTQGNIVAIRPLKGGSISDYSVTEKMLRYFLQKALGRRAIRKPNVSICLPGSVTEVERRAVEEAAYQAGARGVVMVNEAVAAAIGAGIDITRPVGNLVVDIGGAATNIAVVSLGSAVIETNLRVAGDYFNDMIARQIRKEHSLFVDEETAELIKVTIGTVFKRPKEETMQVSGRNVMTGIKKTVMIGSEEIRIALLDAAREIAEGVHGVLEKTPPELAADIAERGIVLTGGSSMLDGMQELIEERTAINVMVAENPGNCVAVGTGLYRESMDKLGRMVY